MKRTRDYAGDEPNGKRPKRFDSLLQEMGNHLQSFVQNFANFAPGQGLLVHPASEPLPLPDKQEPYGHQEKAQKIIKDLYNLWQKTSMVYERRSSALYKAEIVAHNQEIQAYFQTLEKSHDEEAFENTIWNICFLALKIASIDKMTAASGAHKEYDFNAFNSFLSRSNLIESFTKKVLIELEKIFEKYKRAFQYLTRLKEQDPRPFTDAFWEHRTGAFKTIQTHIGLLERYKPKNLTETVEGLSQTLFDVINRKNKYADSVKDFYKDMLLGDGNCFFEANLVFNKANFPPEVTAQIVLPAINPYSNVLKFSEQNVAKLQQSMWDTMEARSKKSSPSNP